jgi:hypothetical protein
MAPKIKATYLKDSSDYLAFVDIEGPQYIANALRRGLMIYPQVYYLDSTIFNYNTCIAHNEEITHRLQCLPIIQSIFSDSDIDKSVNFKVHNDTGDFMEIRPFMQYKGSFIVPNHDKAKFIVLHPNEKFDVSVSINKQPVLVNACRNMPFRVPIYKEIAPDHYQLILDGRLNRTIKASTYISMTIDGIIGHLNELYHKFSTSEIQRDKISDTIVQLTFDEVDEGLIYAITCIFNELVQDSKKHDAICMFETREEDSSPYIRIKFQCMEPIGERWLQDLLKSIDIAKDIFKNMFS